MKENKYIKYLRDIVIYTTTMLFFAINECHAWRYSDDFEEDYSDKSSPNGISGGIFTLIGTITFFLYIKNIVLKLTKDKATVISKLIPILFFCYALYADFFFKFMVLFGFLSIIVILSESSEGMFMFIGMYMCGVMGLLSLFAWNDGGKFIVATIIGAHVIMHIDEKIKTRFIDILQY